MRVPALEACGRQPMSPCDPLALTILTHSEGGVLALKRSIGDSRHRPEYHQIARAMNEGGRVPVSARMSSGPMLKSARHCAKTRWRFSGE